MKRPNCRQTCVFLCILLLGIVSGCGKKGLPIPPPEEIPPAVTDLAAVIDGQTLTLTWTLPQDDRADDLTGFRIYRSTDPRSTDSCRDCPVRFQLFADIMIGDFGATVSEDGKVTYTTVLMEDETTGVPDESSGSSDEPQQTGEKIKAETGYQYKVVGYTAYKVKSPDSNVAMAVPTFQTEAGQVDDEREE